MMADVVVALGFTGCSPCGAPHPGFGKRGSDIRVMMGTVVRCSPTRLALGVCVLDPLCKVKSNRFVVTRGYESLGHYVTS